MGTCELRDYRKNITKNTGWRVMDVVANLVFDPREKERKCSQVFLSKNQVISHKRPTCPYLKRFKLPRSSYGQNFLARAKCQPSPSGPRSVGP